MSPFKTTAEYRNRHKEILQQHDDDLLGRMVTQWDNRATQTQTKRSSCESDSLLRLHRAIEDRASALDRSGEPHDQDKRCPETKG